MKNKHQKEAKRKLRRNFFREAMIREQNLEHKKQISENIKSGIKNKRLSTKSKVAM